MQEQPSAFGLRHGHLRCEALARGGLGMLLEVTVQWPLLWDGEGAACEVLMVTPGMGTGTLAFPLLGTRLGGEAGEEQERWQPGGGGSQGKG